MSVKSKIKLLDNVFSQFVRLRDTDRNGVGHCISSGRIITYNDCDAGHLINRKNMSLRFNERNVNAQSRADNRFDEGNIIGYIRGIKNKYGENIVNQLESCKHLTMKFTEFELNELIKYYRIENKKLSNYKNFKINLK